MADKFVTKDYLLEQFEGYDREIATPKYGNQRITVDSTLSSTSENPVQNKVINTALSSKIASDEKGAANGVATLDVNGKVPASQLPSGSNISDLDDLSDVNISNPANNQIQ